MAKLRMLFVDDRSKRLHGALEKFSNEYDVTLAANVKECLRLLSRYEWDVVSLDHDLNGCDFEDPDFEGAGMEIVRYLEKTGWPENKHKPRFWIHSSNMFAAHLMVIRLNAINLYTEWKRFEYPKNMYARTV